MKKKNNDFLLIVILKLTVPLQFACFAYLNTHTSRLSIGSRPLVVQIIPGRIRNSTKILTRVRGYHSIVLLPHSLPQARVINNPHFPQFYWTVESTRLPLISFTGNARWYFSVPFYYCHANSIGIVLR